MLIVVLHQQDVMKQHVKLHLVIRLLLVQQTDMAILILHKEQIQQMFFGNLFHHFYQNQHQNKLNVKHQNQF